jgi:hypothetical protein
MKTRACLTVSVAILAATGVVALADGASRTFRTPAAMQGVIRDTDVGGKPAYDFEGFAGHDLVNLALGTPLSTKRTNEVLAVQVECDNSAVALVVFDRAGSSNLATIATSTRIDVVQQQNDDTTAFPNRERFVTLMNVATLGSGSNGLAGGYLTVAGRIHLNPATGCPRAVRVDTDRRDDRRCGDPTEAKETIEKDPTQLRAGRAHFIGVLDIISEGNAHTVLVPVGTLTIRRQLSP